MMMMEQLWQRKGPSVDDGDEDGDNGCVGTHTLYKCVMVVTNERLYVYLYIFFLIIINLKFYAITFRIIRIYG